MFKYLLKSQIIMKRQSNLIWGLALVLLFTVFYLMRVSAVQSPVNVNSPSPNIKYGGKVVLLSYNNLKGSTTWAQVESELSSMKANGITYYAIHLNYDPWFISLNPAVQKHKVEIVDQAVNWIQSHGGKVHIVNSCCESFRDNPVSFSEFSRIMVAAVSEWDSRYHPDAVTTIKEVGWYLPMIQNTTLNLSEISLKFKLLGYELSRTSKNISPSTRTVYAETTDALIRNDALMIDFLKSMLRDSNLDIVGLDIYGYKCGGDKRLLELGSTLDLIRSSGKTIWITETWATTKASSEFCINQSQLEAKWMQRISEYAVKEGIPVVEWFYFS